MGRTGWSALLVLYWVAATVVSLVIALLVREAWIFLVLLLIFMAGFAAWSASRIEFSWTMPRTELLDDLSDEDTSERSARQLVSEYDQQDGNAPTQSPATRALNSDTRS